MTYAELDRRLREWAKWVDTDDPNYSEMSPAIEAVEKAVARLQFGIRPKMKNIVTGYYLERRSTTDVARELNLSFATANTMFSDAMIVLATAVPECDRELCDAGGYSIGRTYPQVDGVC